MNLRLILLASLLGGLLVPTARANDDIIVIQFLQSTGADADASARARWRDKGEGVFDFNIELDDMSPGSYALTVGGASQGSIDVDGTGEGEIEFKTPLDPPKPLFDFEVFGQVIEISQGATVFFSDTFEGGGGVGDDDDDGDGDDDDDDDTKTEVNLTNVGPDANAKGKMKYEAKPDRTKFQVEVEKLDAGTYDLIVGGAAVSEIVTTGPAEVEIEFQDPVEPGKVLLNFDPLGQLVEIARDGTVYLSGVMPGANADTGTNPPKKAKRRFRDLGKSKFDGLQVELVNTGMIPGANGKAVLKHTGEWQLEVEIEDAPAGTYGLYVDDVHRGDIVVAADGQTGEIKFHPLTFSVKQKLIEVRMGADAVLSTVFPKSVQEALDKFRKEKVKETRARLNLVNAGDDLDAWGLLTYKITKSGREILDLKTKDLPVGEHDVIVGGIETIGALAVTKEGGRAKVKFDTQPKGKSLLLDFPVDGMMVEVVDTADTVLLTAEVALP